MNRHINKSDKPAIICTLGTTTDNVQTLSKMIELGMSYARINTAYADIKDYNYRINMLKSIADIPVIMDIKGPQIRLKSDKNMHIDRGDILMIGFKDESVHFSKDFYDDVKVDDQVLFENGTIKTRVLGKDGVKRRISIRVDDSGDGNFHKDIGVNIPERNLNVELFSEKDIKIINYVVENNLEYIAQSYVRGKDDVKQLYKKIIRTEKALGKICGGVGIIAKIENEEGIKNLDEIISYARKKDINLSVMVARGDMHVELPSYKVPYYQKQIIQKCRGYGVPVIVATGFLESMSINPSPSRSEISDVANAVIDGCDGIMLSSETSNSKYPSEAVFELSRIIDEYSRK